MREIIFRGKTAWDLTWVYGYLSDNGISCRIIPKESVVTDGNVLTEFYELNPKTVGQFTGLKDSKGNEIYEGDILRWKHAEQKDKDNYFYMIEHVVFSNGSFGFEKWNIDSNGLLRERLKHLAAHAATDDLYYIEFEAEKIGNIHDNPELLKQN